jgi:hypothetical protein
MKFLDRRIRRPLSLKGSAWAAGTLATEEHLFAADVAYSLPSTFEAEAGLGFLKPVDVTLKP